MKPLGRWHNHLFTFALLVFSLWVGRYWYSQEFGLYEDDYTRTPSHCIASSLGRFYQEDIPENRIAMDGTRPTLEIYYEDTMEYCVPIL